MTEPKVLPEGMLLNLLVVLAVWLLAAIVGENLALLVTEDALLPRNRFPDVGGSPARGQYSLAHLLAIMLLVGFVLGLLRLAPW